MADVADKYGMDRKDTFDDGTGSGRSILQDGGYSQNWPQHMQDHFKEQDNINQMMEDRISSAIKDRI